MELEPAVALVDIDAAVMEEYTGSALVDEDIELLFELEAPDFATLLVYSDANKLELADELLLEDALSELEL